MAWSGGAGEISATNNYLPIAPELPEPCRNHHYHPLRCAGEQSPEPYGSGQGCRGAGENLINLSTCQQIHLRPEREADESLGGWTQGAWLLLRELAWTR